MKKINKTIAIAALAFAATFSAQSANAQTVSGTTSGIEGKTQTVIGEDATAGFFNDLKKLREKAKKNSDKVPSIKDFIEIILLG